jgi:hypothetical protein
VNARTCTEKHELVVTCNLEIVQSLLTLNEE